MIFHLKAKSEDYILDRLIYHINILNNILKDIFQLQSTKTDTNRRMVQGIKEQGKEHAIAEEKGSIVIIIDEQIEKIKNIQEQLVKSKRLTKLLIHIEQTSLAIHSSEKNDDLSDMIDLRNMPYEKFHKEIEHVQLLSSSFEMLKVELEQQKDYIQSFDLSGHTVFEHYFYESEKLEARLSQEETVKISHLEDFCHDFKSMIEARISSRTPFKTEADRVAREMSRELTRIRIRNGYFEKSMESFIRNTVRENVRSRNMQRLITFLINFLLSRLKKYSATHYYSQLRATRLIYDLGSSFNHDKKQLNIITLATLIVHLGELSLDMIAEDEELKYVKESYRTVSQLFKEELAFVSGVLEVYRNTGDEPSLAWIDHGASMIKLVYLFDKSLVSNAFNATSEKIVHEVNLKGVDKELAYLVENWQRIITQDLRKN